MHRSRFVFSFLSAVLLATSVAPSAFAEDAAPVADPTIARPVATDTTAAPQFNQGILFPYSLLDRALTGRVNENGLVDYVALKDNADLARFLQAVATADITRFPVFQIEPSEDELKKDKAAKPRPDRSAELVFWINAYNAHFLKAVTDAYPVDSVDQIKDLQTATRRVAGEDLTFAQMRDRIAKLDPRALFALTDGTPSGPLLNPTAYRWASINSLLEHAVMSYINNPDNVVVKRIDNRVEVAPFLTTVDAYFVDPQIAGGAERRKMTGVRALLSQYSDKRANKSYLTTNDYVLVEMPANRRLNVKGVTVHKLQ
jgi:hypothetical protein